MSSTQSLPNASYPEETAAPAPRVTTVANPNLVLPDAVMKANTPQLPYTDPATGQEGSVDMIAVRRQQDLEDSQHIMNSPMSETGKNQALKALWGNQPIPEEVLAKAQPQGAASFGQPGTDLNSPEAVNDFAQNHYQESLAGNENVAAGAEANARQKAQIDSAQLKAQAPADQHMAEFARGQFDGLQQFQAQQQQKTQDAINRYNQINEDMQKVAVQKPQDIFGQAGVNGVMGRISIFFGGAGTNGAHENRNLAYIQGLADKNIAQQERNWTHMQAVGEQDKTLYGMIRNQTQDGVQTANIMHNMALSAYEAQVKSIGNAYGGQRTQLAMNQELTRIAAAKQQLDEGAYNSVIGTAQKTMLIAGRQSAEMAKLQFKAQTQADKDALYGLPGWKGRTTTEQHAKLAEFQAGGFGIVDGLDRIEKVLRDPKATLLDKQRLIPILQAIIKGDARKFFETGTRLEGPEIGQMETVTTNQLEDLMKGLLGNDNDVTRLMPKINSAKQEIRRAVYTKIKGGVTGIERDATSPVWGGTNPEDAPHIGDTSDGSVSSYARDTLKQLKMDRNNDGAGHWGEH